MTTGVPYRVYGGLRFFERMEIKNALAYLRLSAHHDDDASFERIVNTPARGIGAKTLDDMRIVAREHNLPLWQACERMLAENRLTARAGNALKTFMNLIAQLGNETAEMALHETVKTTVEKSGLIELYKKEKLLAARGTFF